MSNGSSLEEKLRNNQVAIAEFLTGAFATNDTKVVVEAFKTAMRAQNVLALAESAGMRRESLYRTFGGAADPKLSSVIKLLVAMNVQITLKPVPSKPQPPRTRVGRPKKSGE
jgi:probable addiction module antidote protein